MNKIKSQDSREPFMRLSDALRRVKKLWPYLPLSGIRAAVVDGEVPHRRSSSRNRAHYYVQWSALKRYLDTLESS